MNRIGYTCLSLLLAACMLPAQIINGGPTNLVQDYQVQPSGPALHSFSILDRDFATVRLIFTQTKAWDYNGSTDIYIERPTLTEGLQPLFGLYTPSFGTGSGGWVGPYRLGEDRKLSNGLHLIDLARSAVTDHPSNPDRLRLSLDMAASPGAPANVYALSVSWRTPTVLYIHRLEPKCPEAPTTYEIGCAPPAPPAAKGASARLARSTTAYNSRAFGTVYVEGAYSDDLARFLMELPPAPR